MLRAEVLPFVMADGVYHHRVDPRLADSLRLVWTVFPGVDLVAYRTFGVVSVFYMLGPRDVPIRTWNQAELLAKRDGTRLALTVGQA